MAQKLNYVVATVSPNLYQAASQANLDKTQVNQIEQFSWAVDKNRKLMQMPTEQAKIAFDNLDAEVQEMLKFLYPNADYSLANPDFGDKAFGAIKGAAKFAASPLIGVFKAVGAYSRLINLPYLMARQATQGEGLFNKQTFTDAWDGRRVFDHGFLKDAIDYFGNEKVEVAKGLIAGKKPGEIIESYGKVDQKLLDALSEAFNNPNEFRQVLDAVKYAQVNPGNDISRQFEKKPARADSNLYTDYFSPERIAGINVSGAVNFTYQIAIDPLTYLMFGANKIPMLGAKLAKGDEIAKAIYASGGSGVKEVFEKYPQVANHWDNQIGPMIKELHNAKSEAEKVAIRRRIGDTYRGHDNEEWLQMLDRNEIFDSASAIKYFGEDVDAAVNMLAGRVEGTQYFRNGIATTRNQRRLTKGMATAVDRYFNPAYGSFEEIQKAGDDIWDALINVGKSDEIFDPRLDDVLKFEKQMSTREKIARQTARSPQSRAIMLGDDAIKTVDNFRDTARQVLPRDLADLVAYKFINSDPNDQVAVLKSLYTAIMQRYGLDGLPEGRKLIQETLDSHFGAFEGAAVIDKIEVPVRFVDEIDTAAMKLDNGDYLYESTSIIHPFQEAKAIGNLDYQLLAEAAWKIKSKTNLISSTLKGAGQSKLSSEFVNAWTILTLFPRLGIRSAIDEGFLFLLTAPSRDIFDYFARKGHRVGRLATAWTGSKAAEGVKESIRGIFGKRTSELLDTPQRKAIREKVAKDTGLSEGAIFNFEYALASGKAIDDIIPSGLDDVEMRLMAQAFAYHTHLLAGAARSISGKASLSSRQAPEIAEEMVGLNNYEDFLKSIDAATGKGGVVSADDIARAKSLGDNPVAKVHYQAWVRRFYGNTRTINGKTPGVFHPVNAFFDNNGLETAADFARARDTLLRQVGIYQNERLIAEVGEEVAGNIATKYTYKVDDPTALKDFLTMSQRTTVLRNRGYSDIDIAKDQINRILLDMYTTFHGNKNNFNSALLDKLRSAVRSLEADEVAQGINIANKWNKAAQSITVDEFVDLTKGMNPRGRMYTTLDIDGINDFETAYKKLGNNMMDIMDRQVQAIFRQPAVMIAYLRWRKNLTALENQHFNQLKKARIDDLAAEGRTLSKEAEKILDRNLRAITERKFTEYGLQRAADEVLKFVDNPNIRSNFALSVRNVGRFYRATEDFWRRIYRLRDVSVRVLFRTRLMHLGLQASGDIYEDANGEPYVMMPMDDIVFKTVDSISRTLGAGNPAFKQPAFNDFTFKLRLSNPSFSPDAGLPTLSGPIAALGVLGMKAILGQAGTTGQKIGEELDNYALGSIGEGMDIVRALVPASLQRVYAITPFNEKSRQEATAAMQAIAYNAAFGNQPSPNATQAEKYEYLKNVRISAHNLQVMRSVLGLFSPVVPTVMETKGVPDYLKDVGITGLRPEFYDIVNAAVKKFGSDIEDPYELAVATFVGNNPNKLIYTVSREDKQTKVVIQKTKEMKDWYISNKKLIDTYGEAAFIFAPHTGDFDAGSYAFLEAAGFIENKELEQYYMDVLVARDKQAYYNIGRQEREALANTPGISLRRMIIDSATASRNYLKMSNPLLEAAITGTGNEIATEQNMFRGLEEMLANPDISIQSGTRSKLLILTNQIRGFINLANDAEARELGNFAEIKRERKAQIEALVAQFLEGDLVVKEANRAVFSSILDFYSRDTRTVFVKGF